MLKFIALAEQSPLGELPRLETPPKEPQRYDLSELLSKPLHVIWREPRRDLLLGVECDDAKGTSLPGGTYDGVLVSLPRSCRAKVIEHPTGGRDLVLADVRFAAQDSGAALVLPVERTRFIARKTTYAFSKGRLTQTTYDRPSSALAAASLPADIVMGAVNQLSLAIQGRKGVSQAEADRLNAQANIYTAQSALIKARTEAKAAAAKETEPATPAPAAP